MQHTTRCRTTFEKISGARRKNFASLFTLVPVYKINVSAGRVLPCALSRREIRVKGSAAPTLRYETRITTGRDGIARTASRILNHCECIKCVQLSCMSRAYTVIGNRLIRHRDNVADRDQINARSLSLFHPRRISDVYAKCSRPAGDEEADALNSFRSASPLLGFFFLPPFL